jgi:hypothetical protein
MKSNDGFLILTTYATIGKFLSTHFWVPTHRLITTGVVLQFSLEDIVLTIGFYKRC